MHEMYLMDEVDCSCFFFIHVWNIMSCFAGLFVRLDCDKVYMVLICSVLVVFES